MKHQRDRETMDWSNLIGGLLDLVTINLISNINQHNFIIFGAGKKQTENRLLIGLPTMY